MKTKKIVLIKAGLRCPDPSCRLNGWRCLKCLLQYAGEQFDDIDGDLQIEMDSGKSFFEYMNTLPDAKIVNTIIDKKDWMVSTVKGDFNENFRHRRSS